MPTPPFWMLLLSMVLASGFAVAGAAGADARQKDKEREEAAVTKTAPGSPSPLPTIAEATAGLEARPGLLTLHVDRRKGRVLLELPPPGAHGLIGEYIHVEGLRTGLGSNPVGLDRGQFGDARLVVLRRLGTRVLLEQQNPAFSALQAPAVEQRAVAESFATSILWGGEVIAMDEDGRALVDLDSLLLGDAHGSAAQLKLSGQGKFEIDRERSAVDVAAVKAFPDNLELEAVLTLVSDEPGLEVAKVAPHPRALTLVQHQSLVRLPPPGYRPRPFDPRAGSFEVRIRDHTRPLAADIDHRFAVRHRLEKVDPFAARSPVRKPIVYYVDPATPEPVKSAVLDGARWWTGAFEDLGLVDAFRVEVLPADKDPLDARYHVVQWVHRSTRGWSYGGGVVDPRSGEVVKGHVVLGSLRVRHDRMLFEGLAGTGKTGSGLADDPVVLALARIRQLAAHEVGHSLGLAHNFAASTLARASVMDYPAPLVKVLSDGSLDFSEAYATGIGAWDRHAIRYAYAEVPQAGEDHALKAIVAEGLARGLFLLGDDDARPAGAAHPRAGMWDNGDDPVEGLALALRVRRVALARFGEEAVLPGAALARLAEVLGPVYFHHRYAVEVAAKLVGGVEYRHALRGDGQAPPEPVSPARQRQALAALTAAMAPEELDLPDRTLGLIPPEEPGAGGVREVPPGAATPVLDPLALAGSASGLVGRALLAPARAQRLVDRHRIDPSSPGLEEVMDALVKAAFGGGGSGSRTGSGAQVPSRRQEIARASQTAVAESLLALAADPEASPAVKARVEARLKELARVLSAVPGSAAGGEGAHRAYLARNIHRYLARAEAAPGERTLPPRPPQGPPIGQDDGEPGCSFGG